MIAAMIPACGRSARMGAPKLLLPIGGVPLIQHVIKALRDGGVELVLVVGPPASFPAASEVHKAACAARAKLLVPAQPTPDMRASFEAGIEWLISHGHHAPEALLLSPGDSPAISANLVSALIFAWREHDVDFVVPTHEGKRGHPLLMSWRHAQRVRDLPPNTGVNRLLVDPAARIHTIPTDDPEVVLDLDTPEDYRRWSARK